MYSIKFAAFICAGIVASASAFAPTSVVLRAPCTTPATCVRSGNVKYGDELEDAPPGSYRDEKGNLVSPDGKILQQGTGRGSDADVAAEWFAQQEKAKADAAAEALKPRVTIDMSGDEELMKWKAEKEAQRAEQEAAVEAKMKAWMEAAAAKKAAEGQQ